MRSLLLSVILSIVAAGCLAGELVTIECRMTTTGAVCTVNQKKACSVRDCQRLIQQLAAIPDRPRLRYLIDARFPAESLLSLLHVAGKAGFTVIEACPLDGQEYTFDADSIPGVRVRTPLDVGWGDPNSEKPKKAAPNLVDGD